MEMRGDELGEILQASCFVVSERGGDGLVMFCVGVGIIESDGVWPSIDRDRLPLHNIQERLRGSEMRRTECLNDCSIDGILFS